MKKILRFAYSHRLGVMLAVDAVALAVFYYCIPFLRRPLEVLLVGIVVLAAATAAMAGNALRAALLVAVSIAATLFALEMAEKYYHITGLFASAGTIGEGGASWQPGHPGTYPAALAKALAGLPDAYDPTKHFAGDIFAGMERSRLVVERSDTGSGTLVLEALKPYRTYGPPLGFELTPGNRVRNYFREETSGAMLFDGSAVINGFGFRETRGGGGGAETYLFLGCSFTYGYGLNDDQTYPHFFSEALGFAPRVLNLGLSGYGPSHALRDLQLDYHAGRVGVAPDRVKGVFYGLIDSHPERVVRPQRPQSPYYVLENGRAVFKGTYLENAGTSRLTTLLEKDRFYPVLRDRLAARGGAGLSHDWLTTIAVLAEMDRLCRERYGVGLTVVSWSEKPEVNGALGAAGIAVIPARDAFEADWQARAARYYLFDGHPSAYANMRLGKFIAERIRAAEGAGGR